MEADMDDWLTLREAIQIWNRICVPTLPGVRVVNQQRAARFKARQQEIEEYRSAEGFEKICRLVLSSPFLRGEHYSESHPGWTATFDFILQASSAARLVEGVYHYRNRSRRPQKTYPLVVTNRFSGDRYSRVESFEDVVSSMFADSRGEG